MKQLDLPPKRPLWGVAEFKATRDSLRAALGMPHHVETDSSRTMGGEEDHWYFQSESGQRIGVMLRVPYMFAVLACDPADAAAAIKSLGPAVDGAYLRMISPPARLR